MRDRRSYSEFRNAFRRPERGGGSCMSTPAVELVGLTKSFGSVTAVDDLDLRIEDGEFFSMLGPSG